MFKLKNTAAPYGQEYPVYKNPTSSDLNELYEFLYNNNRSDFTYQVRMTVFPTEKKYYIFPAQLLHKALSVKLQLEYPDTTDTSISLEGNLNKNGTITDLDSDTLYKKKTNSLKRLLNKEYYFLNIVSGQNIKKLINSELESRKINESNLEKILLKWKVL